MKEWNYENEQWTKLPGHLKHLPLFTRNTDWVSIFIRFLWWFILKIFFKIYIRLEVVGDYRCLFKKHPKLILISNHSSHLDAITIASSIPLSYWSHLYLSAAKDYFFSNLFLTFFSKHCLGAIPIDRRKDPGGSIRLCLDLIRNLNNIWLVLFPEGTRSPSGKIYPFKRGAHIFSTETQTPVLFLYLQGNHTLWPKGRSFAKPGPIKLFVGPVHKPDPEKNMHSSYKKWVQSIDPKATFEEIQA